MVSSPLPEPLFEAPPAPTQKMIVPVGRGAWWGVDPSTLRVAVAAIDSEGDWCEVRTAPFRTAPGARRLAEVYDRTLALASALGPAPGLVVVEQPSGKHVHPVLERHVGVIVAVLERFAPVEMVPPATWKLVACGKGNLYKPKRGEDRPYEVLLWARRRGYRGSSWDEADAWGVAEYGRRTWELDQR